MLKHIDIKGYRSLKDVSLDMEPLNVLIGPNGGGKSNFMDVFALLNEASQGDLAEGFARRGGFASLAFGASDSDGGDHLLLDLQLELDQDSVRKMLVRYHLHVMTWGVVLAEAVSLEGLREPLVLLQRQPGESTFTYLDESESLPSKFKIGSPSELAIHKFRGLSTDPPCLVLDWLQALRVYPPLQVGAGSELRRPQITRAGTRVYPKCANAIAVLHAIRENHPSVWDVILEVLKVACLELHHITFPPEGGDGRIILRWFEKPFDNEAGFSTEHLSDGIMRMLALVAILMTPDPPPLICIDEPEIGLHPELVELVAELLQSAATRTQVIVATHSPELVSKLKPNEVIVVEKEAGATVMERLSEEELAVWLDKFRLGDLWTSGHIGGRP